MIHRLLPLIALVAFASVPLVLGNAEEKKGASTEVKEAKESKDAAQAEVAQPAKKFSTACLVSEEIIQDMENREQKLKEREESLKEKEKELAAQQQAISEELAKLDVKRGEFTSVHQKEISQREEQVNKLIETFEGMSPKAAAQVLGGVEDELAVIALTRLSSAKAGKILANLKADKSARLSEMMAYGKPASRKENARGESERAPASSNR